MNSKETGKAKFGMQRTAIALAVASAFGLGANAAFAVAPVISTYTPAVSATSAGIAADLQLNFNQNVTAVTGKNINIYKSDTTLVETIAADNTSKVTVSSGKVTINPTADLALSTGYYVQIDAGAFQNAGVEDYAGISDATTWNFTTAAGATVTSYAPANGAADFVETVNLSLTFVENMTAVSGKNIKIYNAASTLIETIAANDTAKVTLSGGTITINPAAILPVGNYYVQIDAGAFTGNTSSASYAGIADTTTWAFTAVADASAPAASGQSDNATGATPGGDLYLFFNEGVSAVSGKNIKIYKSDNTLIETIATNDTAKVTLSSSKGSIIATINPTNDLAFNTGYYVQIDAGAFQDAATTPNAYAGISDTTTWNFTTAGGATVTSYYPANGASNHSETGILQLAISENVTAVAGKSIKIYKSDNTLVETIAVADINTPANPTAKVYILPGPDGGYYLTINPAANLSAGNYYVQIDAGAFTGNTSGASYAGIADTTTWAFTTVADTTAPTISTYNSPADNATAASPGTNFTLYFNESVTAVTGKNLKVFKSDNTLVETIATNDTAKVTVSGSKVTVNPAADLALNTGYYVQIDAGAFQDAATTPNAYAGISDATTWNFTTAGGATVTSYYPANGATNHSETGVLQLDISEDMTAVAGKSIKIYKSDNTLVETIAADDINTPANPTGKVFIFNSSGAYYLTITPATTLAAGSYYVNIDAGAAVGNVSGASYAGIADSTTWAFTTVADTTAPAVYGLAPLNNATTVSLTADLGMAFFDRVTAVAGKNIVIKKSSDNSVVETIAADDTAKVTVFYGMVTINPAADLAYSTDYYVNVDAGAFQDKATTPNAYAGISGATTWKFTTAAAPAPAPSSDSGSYTPPPPTPATTTVAPGGTTTIGTSTTPVEAGAGSTLNVTEGTSGATINLPTPPANGTTATSAVNVVIGGNTLSVKPTESGSVVKTATVTVNGTNATVLNVTAGTAQVTASAANQPLVSVGTGANAVVISSGSASATVITSVDKATGVTSLTLPKSTTVSDADASVKMTIGGQDVNVKPQGGGDVVVTLATVTVNGVSTQVVSVTGGSAMVTSSQPNQPLLAIGSGNSAIVVTGGGAGSEATSKVDSATGVTVLSVTNGTITLPSNAFAEVGNGFAAIKDGKLYAGEVAVFNSAGKITSVRLGSPSGSAANVGDPIKTAGAAGLTSKATVPNLMGKVARVSDSQDFGDAIAASLGAGYTAKGQNSHGVLSLAFPGGGSANAMPIGDITVDTSRADGVTATGNGKVEVVKSGVIASFVPAVADPAQLTGQAIALDKNASVTVNEYGVLQASLNGITYALQPGWVVSKAGGGTAGFTTDAQGNVVYQDSTGNQQTLYPAFADLAQLVAAFKGSDANLSATGNDDGTVTAKLLGKTYTLTPDYAFITVPAEHAKDAWWADGNGKMFIKNGDGKTAQGFAVK